ncbi:MAG: hypothetical protein HY457_02060 [Parcubacteria group bacterium]|nr:hypothetical protein [Parcubacteria group bacterium]
MPLIVWGHNIILEEVNWADTSTIIPGYGQLGIAGLFLGALLLLALIVILEKPVTEFFKAISFLLFVAIALGGTWVLVDKTLDDVRLSPTGGPVHWHADFRIFNCGKEINLVDPVGLSNRIGTSEVHEHDDFRIHIEGIIATMHEASLGHFFEAIGGELTNNRMVVPTNEGMVVMENGDTCQDGAVGTLQTFLWSTDTSREIWVAKEQKLGPDFPEYVIAPETIVPPGDCIIFDFDSVKKKTFRTCEQLEAAENRGDLIISWPDLGDDIRN